MVDLLDIEVHEPVYRYRVLRCMNDDLRNPEQKFDLYFSSDSLRQAERVCAEENNNKFGDIFKIVDGGTE